MKYLTFCKEAFATYPVAILAPKLNQQGMTQEYLDISNLAPEHVIAYQLFINGKKTNATERKEFLDDLLPILDDLETQYLLVTDGEYFKTLTGTNKADAYLGYVLPNKYPASMAGQFNVIFIPNFRQVFYNPAPTRAKIKQAMDALYDHAKEQYTEPGHEILHHAVYPESVTDIALWLQKLIDMDRDLTCDIEGFSLKHYDAGVGTISFAWTKHEGIAFPVDLGPNGKAVRDLLKTFFIKFERKLMYHNISYDVTVLIYQLFMEDIIDTEGLLYGLEVMLKNWDDTKLITYLATNSCAGNKLGLKENSQEFTGNYAVEEIKDIRKIPLSELLEYNLIDSCATWFVYEKYWDTLVQDDQLEIYTELFKPAIVDIIQMQLTGMPLNMDTVRQTKVLLEVDRDDALARIHQHKLVQEFTYLLNEEWVEHRNSTLKKKQIKLGDEPQTFNPNSTPQMQRLIYEIAGLPIIERTKTKQPATGAEVLEKLKAYTEDQSIKDMIDAFLDYAAVDKIYGTFIPAMESAIQASDGAYYLFGSFNLGGTVSGRLSSSNPNLQTIPATGSKYAKLIKQCFQAPKGWVMIGLDFDSLEDRISALTTKDTNKLKVYLDGFDGHCLRAHAYFSERMPDIRTALPEERCFKIQANGEEFFLKAGDTVKLPSGISMKVEDYYETYRRV